jgi:hypothetical protein
MMTQAPHWREVETRLVEQGKMAIERFATEHPDLTCSFFAIAADPLSGAFFFCFDTPHNAIHQATKQELFALGQRQSQAQWKRSESWRYAGALSASLIEYSPSANLFHYSSYAQFSFDWLAFTDSEAYPERQEGQEDYLEGHTRIAIWRAIERLIADKAFLRLHMTAPFRIGYQFTEEALIVLRVLNWPATEGQTIYSVLDSPLARKKRKI